ncbi:hypothetical protein D3C75_1110950 [compost metagenome]
MVEMVAQAAKLIVIGGVDLLPQISFGDLLQGCLQLTDRRHKRADQQPAEQQHEQEYSPCRIDDN